MKIYFERIKSNEYQDVFFIMDDSFPDEEMRTYEKFINLLQTNKYYNIIVAKDKEYGILGFIVIWDLPNCIFIENFAISSKFRSCGIGGQLIDYVTSHYSKTIILEVEYPENEIKERRINFYKRHGFILNEFTYLMPPIREGNDFLPLIIMSYKTQFTDETFNSIKKEIYKIVYELDTI